MLTIDNVRGAFRGARSNAQFMDKFSKVFQGRGCTPLNTYVPDVTASEHLPFTDIMREAEHTISSHGFSGKERDVLIFWSGILALQSSIPEENRLPFCPFE